MFYVIMGVSGVGKSTIGKLLGDRTGWVFYDADDFHPQVNIEKMNRGIALTDSDRLPWLKQLQELIAHCLDQDQQGILACSALKSDYRHILSNDRPEVVFIYLQSNYQTIESRIKQRQGHFMKQDLLLSQFETLEVPESVINIDANQTPEAIVTEILQQVGQLSK
ncbi:carbohydrate kinase, thermoresistant glucokinase family protein [Chondrocystis sp. NIES-4102]|nr:carbohydrate kinase, thermoresistant glucokinase family protein [Chondrocystis sp. NIES-4102]